VLVGRWYADAVRVRAALPGRALVGRLSRAEDLLLPALLPAITHVCVYIYIYIYIYNVYVHIHILIEMYRCEYLYMYIPDSYIHMSSRLAAI